MQAPVLSAEQIRQWDIYTTRHQEIASIDLMERAAATCLEWLQQNNYLQRSFSIFCGKGNNGGDGLALARMLSNHQCKVTVYILEFGHKGTEDFQANLMRLHQTPVEILFVQYEENIHPIPENDVVVDALFGSGLNRPLDGVTCKLVQHINRSGNEVIAVDIPSGMYADSSSVGNEIIKATHTLSFQAFKLAFLLPENAMYTGDLHILNIGLSPAYIDTIPVLFEMIEPSLIKSIYKPRKKDSHKGNYGHAALLAGSKDMMGASVLAAKGCMRSGAGKLTCYIPEAGHTIMQMAIPEAMTRVSEAEDRILPFTPSAVHNVVGIGPGLGKYDTHADLLSQVFDHPGPIVMDADALNVLATSGRHLYNKIPPLSILTPHPKEFERLFGKTANDFERLEKAREKARELDSIIVLKGRYTFIAMPGGKGYFNTTGNPGMATAGSGDVLTGIITGLLAQYYTPEQAALLGVYIHGLAGDIASQRLSEEGMIASDIIAYLPEAFNQVRSL